MGEPKIFASLSSGLLARKGGAKPAMRRPAMNGQGANQDDLGWNDMGYDVDPDQESPMDTYHNSRFNPLANAVPDVTPEVRKQQQQIAEQLKVAVADNYPVEGVGSFVQEPAPLSVTGTWQPEEEEDDLDASYVTDQAQADAYEEGYEEDFEEGYEEDIAGQQFEADYAPLAVPNYEPQLSVDINDPAFVSPLSVKPAPAKGFMELPEADGIPTASLAKVSLPRAERGSKAKAAFTLRLDKERHLKLRLACAVRNKSAQALVSEALDRWIEQMPDVLEMAANMPDSK